MLRKIGLALVVIGLAAVLVRTLVLKLASDETKIRWAIEDAAEGFGDARMDPLLAVLARDFRDEPAGYTREDLRTALAALFFGEKDPETKGFPYRCEVAADAIRIEVVKGEPDRATVTFPGTIVDVRGGTRRDAWSFEVEGRMEERDDGWCFVKSAHTTTGGSLRLRAR